MLAVKLTFCTMVQTLNNFGGMIGKNFTFNSDKLFFISWDHKQEKMSPQQNVFVDHNCLGGRGWGLLF